MIKVKIFGQSDMLDGKIESGAGRGMHFILNGWTLSTQAGWGNYCSEDPTRIHDKLFKNTIRTDCEIALWNEKDSKMVRLENDTVMGWVSWDMVFDIVQWLKKQKKIPTERKVRNKVIKLKRYYDNKEVI